MGTPAVSTTSLAKAGEVLRRVVSSGGNPKLIDGARGEPRAPSMPMPQPRQTFARFRRDH